MGPRLFYFISVAVVIILGITSRKTPHIPLCIGDGLYAVMIYLILRAALLKPLLTTAFTAIVVCFAIEFSQLIRNEWLMQIRNTTLGHYALGEGFLWSDLVAYLVGIVFVLLLDSTLLKKTGKGISGL